LKKAGRPHAAHATFGHWAKLLAIAVLSHTIQIWALALVTLTVGALPSIAESTYFSLVTYTTFGYGDVTLAPEHRIFGAMGAVTGLLAFGLSTALLVGLFGRILTWEDHSSPPDPNS
jgi:hypothetical protein